MPLGPDALDDFISQYGSDISCIAFMGGDADPKGVDMLAQYLHAEHPQYKVAWYTGRLRIPPTVNRQDFDYIKVGPYIRHLGPLNQPTTNQRLYRLNEQGDFDDITSRFWQQSSLAAQQG
jgi:anaerobic ribonucleoside-triphosphate reductase activating protein